MTKPNYTRCASSSPAETAPHPPLASSRAEPLFRRSEGSPQYTHPTRVFAQYSIEAPHPHRVRSHPERSRSSGGERDLPNTHIQLEYQRSIPSKPRTLTASGVIPSGAALQAERGISLIHTSKSSISAVFHEIAAPLPAISPYSHPISYNTDSLCEPYSHPN